MIPPGWRGSLADGFCLTGEDVWSSRLGLFAACAAQTFSGGFDAMSVVDEAVQNGVGVSGIADDLMPVVYGKLEGDDGRPAAISLLEDFKEVVTGRGVERLQPPVVEDQQPSDLSLAQTEVPKKVAFTRENWFFGGTRQNRFLQCLTLTDTRCPLTATTSARSL
jgi:hypothetical protein